MSEERRRYESLNLAALVTREVPREWFGEALRTVLDLRDHIGWNQHERREFAVGTLMQQLHVDEHHARCLVELAILWLKTERP